MTTFESGIHEGVEAQVDLLEFISAIIRNRFRILLLTFVIGLCVYSATYLLEEKYEAITRMIVVEQNDLGGVSPDNRRAPEVMTLVEHGFILGTTRDNLRDVIMAKMRSRTFTELFIDRAEVAQNLFPEAWDNKKERWIGPKPDRNEVFSTFHEFIRFIDHDPKTDIISVRIRFPDPRLASLWANQYAEEFNLYMRNRALEDSKTKQEYLVQQIESTEIVEMQKSLYRLIEAQTAVMMFAESKSEYAVEVLDRAYEPYEKFSPARKRITILAMIGGFLITIVFICARIVVQRIRSELANSQYRH